MENSLIFENTPISIEEIGEKIVSDGKKTVGKLFKEYKDQIDFELDQPQKDNRAKLDLIAVELDKLNLTFKDQKTFKRPSLLKQIVVGSIRSIIDRTSDRLFHEHQYKIQVKYVANSILTLRKKKYLEELYEGFVQQPKQGEKIKWNRSAVEFGEMILQLDSKGYIEVPTGLNAEPSYEKLAKLLFNVFDVTDSWDTFKDALSPNRNKIGKIKKVKLEDFPKIIPEAQDLGALKHRPPKK